ncbi:hypothetical protein D3C87_1778730 [compost metagenome]
MDVNDNGCHLDKRGALTSIASKLAPTVECIDLLNRLLTLDRLLQRLTAALLSRIQLQLHLLDIQHLLLKLLPTLGDFVQHGLQLFLIAAGRIVKLNQLTAFRQ